MYSVTTFWWDGGFQNVPIPAFATDRKSRLLIASLKINIIHKDVEGQMDLSFDFQGAQIDAKPAEEFVGEIIGNMGWCAIKGRNWDQQSLLFRRASGEPINHTMMRRYLNLMILCGVRDFKAPHIVTETFVGRPWQDGEPVYYGKHLVDKLLGCRLSPVEER